MATLRFECIATVIKYNLIKRNRLWNTGLVFFSGRFGRLLLFSCDELPRQKYF